MLQAHSKVAVSTLESLSKKQARHVAKARQKLHELPWAIIVLLLNDMLIPLRPIPFYSQRYCRDHTLEYRTEHDLVVDYIQPCQLEEYIGSYAPREVVV